MKEHTCVVKTTQVVLGLYVEFTTHVGKTFVLSFFETFPSHFVRMTPKNVCMGRFLVAILAFVRLLLCCAFSNVSSKPIQSCICLTFPRDMFWNIPSDCLSKSMQNHIISCICLTFPRCVFSNVSPNCLSEKRHNHIGCICLTFLRYVFSNGLPEMRQSNIDFGFSSLCVFICVLKLRVCENAKSLGCHLFDFSTLYVFKCLRKWPATEDAYCIVTLVAFVWFFCTVYFQMLTGKVTLVAFSMFSNGLPENLLDKKHWFPELPCVW